MSDFLWSPSRNGFYAPAAPYPPGSLPDDLVPITASRHAELMAAQAAGATITADAKGRPRAQLPDASDRRRQLRGAIRAEARRRITQISPLWRQLNDLREQTPAATARFARIDAIRAASTLIEQNLAEAPASALSTFPVATHLLWPEF